MHDQKEKRLLGTWLVQYCKEKPLFCTVQTLTWYKKSTRRKKGTDALDDELRKFMQSKDDRNIRHPFRMSNTSCYGVLRLSGALCAARINFNYAPLIYHSHSTLVAISNVLASAFVNNDAVWQCRDIHFSWYFVHHSTVTENCRGSCNAKNET